MYVGFTWSTSSEEMSCFIKHCSSLTGTGHLVTNTCQDEICLQLWISVTRPGYLSYPDLSWITTELWSAIVHYH